MLLALMILAVAALAYANGANDNFKGVATLHGSGALGFRAALLLATIATLLGSATSIVLADGLLQSFSGKDLVPGLVDPHQVRMRQQALEFFGCCFDRICDGPGQKFM